MTAGKMKFSTKELMLLSICLATYLLIPDNECKVLSFDNIVFEVNDPTLVQNVSASASKVGRSNARLVTLYVEVIGQTSNEKIFINLNQWANNQYLRSFMEYKGKLCDVMYKSMLGPIFLDDLMKGNTSLPKTCNPIPLGTYYIDHYKFDASKVPKLPKGDKYKLEVKISSGGKPALALDVFLSLQDK